MNMWCPAYITGSRNRPEPVHPVAIGSRFAETLKIRVVMGVTAIADISIPVATVGVA